MAESCRVRQPFNTFHQSQFSTVQKPAQKRAYSLIMP
jgi:hypothetical protein